MYKLFLFTILAIAVVRAQNYTMCTTTCSSVSGTQCDASNCLVESGLDSTNTPCACVNCSAKCMSGCTCTLTEESSATGKYYYCKTVCPEPQPEPSSITGSNQPQPQPNTIQPEGHQPAPMSNQPGPSSITGSNQPGPSSSITPEKAPETHQPAPMSNQPGPSSVTGSTQPGPSSNLSPEHAPETHQPGPSSSVTGSTQPGPSSSVTGSTQPGPASTITPCVRSDDVCGDVPRPVCVLPLVANPNPECVSSNTASGKCGWEKNCYTPATICNQSVDTCGGKPVPNCTAAFLNAPECCCTGDNCVWAFTCMSGTPCTTCTGNPCTATQTRSGGACKAAAEISSANKCAWADYTCVDTVTTCNCSDSPRTACPAGSSPDPTAAATCVPVYASTGLVCQNNPTCMTDPCFGITNPCLCDYTKCVFASSSAVNIKSCISQSSDLLNSLSADIATARPSTCAASTAGTPTPVVTAPVDKVGTVVNNPTTVSAALANFASALTSLKSDIDPKTGTNLAADFSVVVLAFAYPEKNADGSVKLSAVTSFIPTTALVTVVTEAHQEVFEPVIRNLLAVVGGFKYSDMSNCTWTPQTATKRQGTTGSTFGISSNADSSAVSDIYGGTATSDNMQQTVSIFLMAVIVVVSLFLF